MRDSRPRARRRASRARASDGRAAAKRRTRRWPAAAPSIEDAPPGAYDRYGGYIVDDAHEAFAQSAVSPETFADALGRWMRRWREEGTRGVWLKINVGAAALVPVARDHGFEFHHAERICDDDVLATGGRAVDDSCERVSSSRRRGSRVRRRWRKGAPRARETRTGERKRPMEDADGIIRGGRGHPDRRDARVMEETGIDTEFGAVIGCRHGHFGLFGKSDLFFCVALRVKDGASREIKIQETEIERAKWASVDEFLDNPNAEAGSHARVLHTRSSSGPRESTPVSRLSTSR